LPEVGKAGAELSGQTVVLPAARPPTQEVTSRPAPSDDGLSASAAPSSAVGVLEQAGAVERVQRTADAEQAAVPERVSIAEPVQLRKLEPVVVSGSRVTVELTAPPSQPELSIPAQD